MIFLFKIENQNFYIDNNELLIILLKVRLELLVKESNNANRYLKDNYSNLKPILLENKISPEIVKVLANYVVNDNAQNIKACLINEYYLDNDLIKLAKDILNKLEINVEKAM